jgi:hypothetical protein
VLSSGAIPADLLGGHAGLRFFTAPMNTLAADCRTITGTPARGSTWTGPYIKVCSPSLPELDSWALVNARSAVTRCGTCQP